MLEGVISELTSDLNEVMEPLRRESHNIDKFLMLFLSMGFLTVTILATVIGYMYNLFASVALVALYILALLITFSRNNRRLLFL